MHDPNSGGVIMGLSIRSHYVILAVWDHKMLLRLGALSADWSFQLWECTVSPVTGSPISDQSS